MPDLRDGVAGSGCQGFEYRSFHDTEWPVVIDDGATGFPGATTAWRAFPAPGGNVWLVRNHEVNDPGAAFGPSARRTTRWRRASPRRRGDPVSARWSLAFTSLNGTQMNCCRRCDARGARWIMCEETVNGPDVAPTYRRRNDPLTQRHGFIFEVPAGGQSNRQPITSAGRFAHEAVAWNPTEARST